MDGQDGAWTDDNFDSGSEREGSGLLSDDDAGPEVPSVSKKKGDDEEKKTNWFDWFPSHSRDSSKNTGGHHSYRVYGWRWLMLVTLFLLNISNGTVCK